MAQALTDMAGAYYLTVKWAGPCVGVAIMAEAPGFQALSSSSGAVRCVVNTQTIDLALTP